MFTVSPSIYSADLLDLRHALKQSAGFEHLHLDIDDGNFVKGISFGMDVVAGIARETGIPLDVHLEVLNPLDYVNPLAESGVDLICAHVEVLDYPSLFLGRVHNCGKKAGLALNVKTPVACIEPYADQLDQVIFVSCEADEEGLLFRPGVLKKAAQAREFLGKNTRIWIDGGVNESNLKRVIEAGADGVVLGRAVYEADDPGAAYSRILALGRQYEEECGRNEI